MAEQPSRPLGGDGVPTASPGLGSAEAARGAPPDAAAVTLRAVTPWTLVPGIDADVRLLHHTMPGVAGRPVPATSLLFVPRGAPPVGGWPVVAWAHGTTTPGQKSCAPSQTPELDGGLTRDGIETGYARQIGRLVGAGYAVAAPDLEGLGPDAVSPYPYYDLASLARSLVAGVAAAHAAEPRLSDRWAAVGHSDGGHGAMGVEAHAGEAEGLRFAGAVAFAPYVAVEAHAARFGAEAEAAGTPGEAAQAMTKRQLHGALMATGLGVVDPSFDPASIMGPDLAATLPRFRALGQLQAMGVIGAAVEARGRAFRGLTPGWAREPRMRAFLLASDPAVMPHYAPRAPVLILQGTADPFILEALQTPFAERLKASGAPVTYKVYDGADHFSVMHRADDDVLAFLRERLPGGEASSMA